MRTWKMWEIALTGSLGQRWPTPNSGEGEEEDGVSFLYFKQYPMLTEYIKFTINDFIKYNIILL